MLVFNELLLFIMLRLFSRKTQPIRLGRWARTNAKRKIDLSNHDHCGGILCEKPLPKKDDYDNSMDLSICALQSFHMYPRAPAGKKK